MATNDWWLITWTTYATWLPGDPRGFQTWKGREYVPPPKRYARPGETNYSADEYKDRYEAARGICAEPVKLTKEQREVTTSALIKDISKLSAVPAIMAIGEVHVHLLARFGELPIRRTIGTMKAAAARGLRQEGLESKRIWSRNCHMKSKSQGREFETAFNYVLKHRQEGALVHVWDEFKSMVADPTTSRRLG